MKILKGQVDWMEGRANRPHLYLLVDKIPTLDDMRFREREGYYFAENDGFCTFYSWRGDNGRGFGGAHFPITMADGEKRTLKGPWSSNSGTMNEHGFGPCMEAALTTDRDAFEKRSGVRLGAAVLVSKLREYASVIEIGTGYTWRPGSSYAAEVVFPGGSQFVLACTGHVVTHRRDSRDQRFWAVPEMLPGGALVENVRGALLAATAADQYDFAREIAGRYVRYLSGTNVDPYETLLALSGYEPAVKLPDGSFWTKPE